MSDEPRIHGRCDSRFSAVRDALDSNFRDQDEIGAAVSVRVEGEQVVDLWGGHRDGKRSLPWEEDTLVNVYSVGKGVLATLTLMLVERGLLALDKPVADLWPEFGAEGKGGITLRTLMAHRGGLPAVRKRLPELGMYDWSLMCSELAAQEPYWEPDSTHGYHCNTFGFLVGELVRRATDRDVGTALRECVTGPLGADFCWGLPVSEHGRVSEFMVPVPKTMGADLRAVAFPATGGPRSLRRTATGPRALSARSTMRC
jgi:CubicO group peptidase (beta-lactamase class C family)